MVSYQRGGTELAAACSFCNRYAAGYHLSYNPNVMSTGGIVNPAFMPDLDALARVQIPPWLAEAELESATVAPSQRAQVTLPWTPSSLRRLAPLRISTRSTDSFTEADGPAAPRGDGEPPLPPPPRDNERL